MNPEAQRIAIAEACGWGVLRLSCGFYAKHKTEVRISISAASARATQTEAMCDRVPDYLNDLNAMHEAEKVLSVREKQNYISTLRNICVVAGCWPETATADQRAEAFLRTLGKWEGKQ